MCKTAIRKFEIIRSALHKFYLIRSGKLYRISLVNRYKAAGSYYIKVMTKIAEKGESYVTNEIARLERMLGK